MSCSYGHLKNIKLLGFSKDETSTCKQLTDAFELKSNVISQSALMMEECTLDKELFENEIAKQNFFQEYNKVCRNQLECSLNLEKILVEKMSGKCKEEYQRRRNASRFYRRDSS